MKNQDVSQLNISQTYDEIFAQLINGTKDGTYIPVVGSDAVDTKDRRNLSRAMCARCERQRLPYKLHAVKTKVLQFWWEERNVARHLPLFEKVQHRLDKKRFDIDVELGVHPAILKVR